MNSFKLPFDWKAVLFLNVILAQAFLVLFFGVLQFWNIFGLLQDRVLTTLAVFYIAAGGFFSLAAIFMLRSVVRLVRARAEAEVNRIRLQETRQMLDVLRTQRHDYLNHLQVIYGLIHVGKTRFIQDYISQVNEEIQNSSRVFTALVHRPEIAGLLMRKLAQAEALGISFNVDLKTDLVLLAIPPLDFSRVLGNLIDNALDAVQTVPEEQRRISFEMKEEENGYVVKITNFRPLIPHEYLTKIFRKGFTTKAGKGEGLGLYIVKSLVEKNHGMISVESNEETGTSFTLRFPKPAYHHVELPPA
ncbi:MAG: Spo0B domain-containing protein [Bacillota bacterium]|nr:Spo0B domain-containing protein [Bacillota bacterium]